VRLVVSFGRQVDPELPVEGEGTGHVVDDDSEGGKLSRHLMASPWMDGRVSLMMRERRRRRLEQIGHRGVRRMSEPFKTGRAESSTIGA
jgi:hypothetical protein